MARLEPLNAKELPDAVKPILEYAQELMGFAANDVLTMARWPELLSAMQQLVGVVYGSGEVPDELKRLVALMVSTAAGCRYCQAHNAHGSSMLPGVTDEKNCGCLGV